jgi:hypothetical protein
MEGTGVERIPVELLIKRKKFNSLLGRSFGILH